MRIGDTVTYTHCTSRGNSIGFFVREAKVIQIMPNNVVVKYRGKLVHLRPDRVRLKGQKSELTEMVLGVSTDEENKKIGVAAKL